MRSTHHQSEVPDPITRPVFITVDHLRDFYPIEYIHYYIHCSLAYHQPSSISANLTRPLTPPPSPIDDTYSLLLRTSVTARSLWGV